MSQKKDIVELIVEMNETLQNNPLLETIAKIIVMRRENRRIKEEQELSESEKEKISSVAALSTTLSVTSTSSAPVTTPVPPPAIAAALPVPAAALPAAALPLPAAALPLPVVAAAALPAVALPSPPGSITLTPGDGEVKVEWTAPTDGSAINSYVVEYEVKDSGMPTQINIPNTDIEKIINGLINGTEYAFSVSTKKGGIQSAKLTDYAIPVAPAVIPPVALPVPAVAPSSPGSITLTPGDREVKVEWTPAADGLPIDSYVVEYEVKDSGATTQIDVSNTDSEKIINGLTNDTEYAFSVSTKKGGIQSTKLTQYATPVAAALPAVPVVAAAAPPVAPPAAVPAGLTADEVWTNQKIEDSKKILESVKKLSDEIKTLKTQMETDININNGDIRIITTNIMEKFNASENIRKNFIKINQNYQNIKNEKDKIDSIKIEIAASTISEPQKRLLQTNFDKIFTNVNDLFTKSKTTTQDCETINKNSQDNIKIILDNRSELRGGIYNDYSKLMDKGLSNKLVAKILNNNIQLFENKEVKKLCEIIEELFKYLKKNQGFMDGGYGRIAGGSTDFTLDDLEQYKGIRSTMDRILIPDSEKADANKKLTNAKIKLLQLYLIALIKILAKYLKMTINNNTTKIVSEMCTPNLTNTNLINTVLTSYAEQTKKGASLKVYIDLDTLSLKGGASKNKYYEKYLKYKAKYLSLKASNF
jgi:hypothetical protein